MKLLIVCLFIFAFVSCAYCHVGGKLARKCDFRDIAGAKFRQLDSTASAIFSLGNASNPQVQILINQIVAEDISETFNYTLVSEGRTFFFSGVQQFGEGFLLLIPHFVWRETYPPITDLDDDTNLAITYSDVHDVRSGEFHGTVIHLFANTTNDPPGCEDVYQQFGHHSFQAIELSPGNIRMVWATLVNYRTVLFVQGCS